MKLRFATALLSAAFCAAIFFGCAPNARPVMQEEPEPEPEIKIDLEQTVKSAKNLIRSGLYDEAGELVDAAWESHSDDSRLQNLRFSLENTELYEGVVEHIFFHPLIAYVERATDGRGNDKGQDLYMVTVSEFKATIEQMYENGYVLVSCYDLFDFTRDEDGVVTASRKPLYLPAGKTPYILSIDDMNYYEYMIEDGQVFKIVFDQNGELASYSVDMDGNDVISRDNCIIPLIDDFVAEHPDASYNGAKGLIGLTGYEGILGYRTNSIKYENYQQEREAVMPVVERLKETGWDFASHSQGHRHTNSASYELIVEDTDRWEYEIRPLVGDTPLYIYPFGEKVKDDDPKMEYFRKNGFAVFFGVGKNPYLVTTETGMIKMDRRAIDGTTLRAGTNSDLLDNKRIADPSYRVWYDEMK